MQIDEWTILVPDCCLPTLRQLIVITNVDQIVKISDNSSGGYYTIIISGYGFDQLVNEASRQAVGISILPSPDFDPTIHGMCELPVVLFLELIEEGKAKQTQWSFLISRNDMETLRSIINQKGCEIKISILQHDYLIGLSNDSFARIVTAARRKCLNVLIGVNPDFDAQLPDQRLEGPTVLTFRELREGE